MEDIVHFLATQPHFDASHTDPFGQNCVQLARRGGNDTLANWLLANGWGKGNERLVETYVDKTRDSGAKGKGYSQKQMGQWSTGKWKGQWSTGKWHSDGNWTAEPPPEPRGKFGAPPADAAAEPDDTPKVSPWAGLQ